MIDFTCDDIREIEDALYCYRETYTTLLEYEDQDEDPNSIELWKDIITSCNNVLKKIHESGY